MFHENTDSIYKTVIIDNIPNELTEEHLLDKCRQVGIITNFKMVRDPDLIKNKMMAYCEFSHVEMALNAFKILNGIDIFGQQLRVALIAETEETSKTLSSQAESNKNPTTESNQAISQAVASLPPDQMFELMKQMKLCIQNNPNEARNMLLQNPQLAYALLQAQIVMKIADPKVAIAMLNRSSEQIPQMSLETSFSHSMPSLSTQTSNIPIYSNIDNPHGILGLSSSFDKIIQNAEPGIENISRPIKSKNQNSFVPHNLSDLSQTSLLPGLANNSNFVQLKNESVPNINDSFSMHGEREKAALIMQVLRLTDQQIAMLPEDQRLSILVLKDQLRNN